jgi:hypothetical protein
MQYSVSKTIKKKLSIIDINRAIEARLLTSKSGIDLSQNGFLINNFISGIGSINYNTSVTFNIEILEDRSTIIASVVQKTTFWFWLFVIIGLLFGVIWIGIPIGMFFYGKKQGTSILDRLFAEISDQLG